MSGFDPCSTNGGWYFLWCSGGDVVELYPYSNGVEGPLPSEIGLLTGLTMVELSSNIVHGSMPTEMGDLTNLRFAMFFENYRQR